MRKGPAGNVFIERRIWRYNDNAGLDEVIVSNVPVSRVKSLKV
jgi:hypothetical protein